MKIEVREVGGPEMPGALIVDGQVVQEYLIPTFDEYRGVNPLNTPPAVNPTAFASNPSYYLGNSYHYTVTYQPPDPAMVLAFQQAAANPGAVAMAFSGLANAHHAALPPMIYNVAVPVYHTSSHMSASSSRAAARNAERALRNLQREYDHYVKNVKLQLKNDADALNRYNTRLQQVRGHAQEILQAVTGLSLADEREAWGAWWTSWNATEGHTPAFNGDAPAPPPAPAPGDKLHRSRLAAGTPVWTDRGQHPIETLRVGDRVLTQDAHSGALSFAAVIDTTRAADDDLLRFTLTGRGVLTVTPLERLWRAGHGWVAASDLKPGDVVRTLGDAMKIVRVEPLPATPVYNVTLSEGAALFVGEPAVLVHDNAIVQPPATPFDAVASLESSP